MFNRTELYASGFKPARHAFTVKLIRKLLFPFIRPFLFFLSDRILEQEKELVELRAELSRFTETSVLLHSELQAFKQRELANSKLSKTHRPL